MNASNKPNFGLANKYHDMDKTRCTSVYNISRI